MSNEILNFDKLHEGINPVIPIEEELRIRSKYKNIIYRNDRMSPVLVFYMEKELERLNSLWHMEGKLCVDKGFDGDAHVSIRFEYKNMAITIKPLFSDGKGYINRHRDPEAFLKKYDFYASKSHPYSEGPSIFAISAHPNTKWVFYYSPEEGKPGTPFKRSRSLLNPEKVYDKINELEEEKGVNKSRRRSIY